MASKKSTKTKSKKALKPPDAEEIASQKQTGLDRATLLQFAILDTRKEALKKELKDVEAAHKVIQEVILEKFASMGFDQVRFLGHTVYIFKQLWARPKDETVPRPALVAALKAHGFKEYIKEDFNVQSVSGRLRELEKQYREMHSQQPKEGRKPFSLADYLPQPLVKVLKLDPDYSIRIQGTIPMDDLLQLQEEVNDGNK
jgi:hypothetical protein